MANGDAFDCKTCRWGRHCDKNNPAPSDIFEIRLKGYNIRQNTCFLPEVDRDASFWLKLYSNYLDGHLINDGGISSQPATYMEAMRFIKWLTMQTSE